MKTLPLLIGLATFASLTTTQATLVYQYDFTPSSVSNDGPISGYIQMKERVEYADYMLGNDGLGLDSIFDLSITVGPKTTPGLPTIPATTYRLDDISSYSQGGFSSTPHGRSSLSGNWSLLLGRPSFEDQTYIEVYPGEIATFWPWAYVFNEDSTQGRWTFSGVRNVRNVPEAGNTLAYLAISVLAVAFSVAISRQSRTRHDLL